MIDGRFFPEGTPAADVLARAFRDDQSAATLSAKFRLYYLLRPLIPISIRQQLQRSRNAGFDVAPDWFVPPALDGFRNALAGPVDIVHPWPNAADYAFVLTHDVETADGFARIPHLADLEEEAGFRSSWNLVPHKYPIDRGIVDDLRSRGFEIGIHGYNHDGRLFASRTVFDRRAAAINRALDEYQCVGFRAPMVHRNLEWLQALHVEYDASCFDVDPFQAMPGGTGSWWPFIAGRFVELPYTMPQDHTLFVTLGHDHTRVWEQKLDFIRQSAGMALMLTHPDYLGPRELDLYANFLTRVGETNPWHALPRDVASWWRFREAPRQHASDNPDASCWIGCAADCTLAVRSAKVSFCIKTSSSLEVGECS